MGETVEHHASRSRTAQRFQQGHGQGAHEVAVHAHGGYAPLHGMLQHLQTAGGPEHAHGHQDGHAVGYEFHGHLESAFCSLYKRVVHIEFLSPP